MGLSCICDDDYENYYIPDNDYSLLSTSKRKRCCSCEELIDLNCICLRLTRFRMSSNDIEDRIYGADVPLAAWYLCEECADIYFSLDALGFCVNLDDMPIKNLLNEYHDLYGANKAT